MRTACTFLTCILLVVVTFAQDPPRPNFGNDTSPWANDGECDDPRFEGSGMAEYLVNEDRFRDRKDCERLYDQGAIWLPSQDGAVDRLEAGEVHRYQFEVPEPPSGLDRMIYQIELRSVRLDTVLKLFRQGEDEPIEENDDYRGNVGHSHITTRLSSGVYTLEVFSFDPDAVGTYGLNIAQINPVTPTPLTDSQ